LVGLLGTTAMALALVACDSRGVPTTPTRPGAERATTSGGLTATAPGRQYDNDARATDETRTAPIGSTVAGRGGQRAQQEAIQREAAERDRAAREVAQREAAQREASRAATPPAPTQAAAPPPAPVTTTAAPPAQPAPQPQPAPQQNVTVAPAPAAAPATPQQTAVVPATPPRPQDPNKAFEPPPGWVPPGRTEAVNQPQPAPTPQQTAASAPPTPAPAATPAPTPTVTTSPVAPPQADQRAPERTASTMPAPSPTPAPPPRAVPTTTTTAVTPATRAPAAQPQTPPQMANLATATSGAVPAGVALSPPLGGPMQVAVIQFSRNSSGLSGEDMQVLRSVADMQRRNGGTVRVLGHASRDVSGTSVNEIRNGNLNLSLKRAESVSALLVRYGVPADAIVVEGVADEEPVYETRTARGVAANRRAEVFIDF